MVNEAENTLHCSTFSAPYMRNQLPFLRRLAESSNLKITPSWPFANTPLMALTAKSWPIAWGGIIAVANQTQTLLSGWQFQKCLYWMGAKAHLIQGLQLENAHIDEWGSVCADNTLRLWGISSTQYFLPMYHSSSIRHYTFICACAHRITFRDVHGQKQKQ